MLGALGLLVPLIPSCAGGMAFRYVSLGLSSSHCRLLLLIQATYVYIARKDYSAGKQTGGHRMRFGRLPTVVHVPAVPDDHRTRLSPLCERLHHH